MELLEVCMLYFSFGNLAFNGKSSESMIDIVISGKSKFKDADAFLVYFCVVEE